MSESPDQKKFNVLFICNHNSARSQMAEAFMNTMYGDEYTAYSAGVQPAGTVNPLAVQVMAEFGIDIKDYRPKSVDALRGKYFDYVVSVCDANAEQCPLVVGNTVPVNMGIVDPTALADSTDDAMLKLSYFRTARDSVHQIVRNIVLLKEKERRDWNNARKRRELEEYHASNMRKSLDCMQRELLKLPHPEPLVCILGSQLKNLLVHKISGLRQGNTWPLVSLVVALAAASTRTDASDLLISGVYWRWIFIIALAIALGSLLYALHKARGQKDVHTWADDIIKEIRLQPFEEQR